MGLTINGVYYSGITVSDGTAANPVTITSRATITDPAGVALQFTGTLDWTIDNAGTIRSLGTGTASLGLSLTLGSSAARGTITNGPTGLLGGAHAGLFNATTVILTNFGSIISTGTIGAAVLAGGGAVANAGGQISGHTGIQLAGAAAVANTGTIRGTGGSGAALAAGGVLSNDSTAGLVSGYTTGLTFGGPGTVINQGTIASVGTSGTGYHFVAGAFTPLSGAVVMGAGFVSNAASGTISSKFFAIAQTGAGSVTNAGVIRGTSGTVGFGILLIAGGAVANVSGGTIGGGVAAVLTTGTTSSTVTNDGLIQGGSRSAIDQLAASNVRNNAGGTITGTNIGVLGRGGGTVVNAGAITAPFGVLMTGTAATATNSGTIISTSHGTGAGIQLKAGGSAINAAGGYISGKWIGIQIGGFTSGTTTSAPGGTVVNDGTLFANDAGTAGAAVWVRGNGVILNGEAGTIAGGPYGIVSYDQVTVVNRGSIGGGNYAVFAALAGNNDRIIVHPGARFSGRVQGDKSGVVNATGTLELAAGSRAGTIAGFGSKYTGFSDVIVDADARWSLSGTVTAAQTLAFPGTGANLALVNPGSMAGTITGFDTTETMTLGGITDVTSATLGAGNVLTVTAGGGATVTLHFDPGQDFGVGAFNFTTAAGDTSLTVPCFAAGTRILTARGEVAVQSLRVGDRVVTRDRRLAEVRWLGHRRVDCRRHPRPADVWPVRVRAGAFGEGLPRRDLLLSPDHAIFLDPVLIKVSCLINDATIVQERVSTVTYWHVELDRHDVLLAEGLPSESYLDTGNRSDFEGGGPVMTLHPNFARDAWNKAACAPLILGGPELINARAALLRRALRLGWMATRDAAPAVLARQRLVTPRRGADGSDVFELPPATRVFRLRSRSVVPAHFKVLDTDGRRLGLAVESLALDGRDVPLADVRLRDGWHGPEDGYRWTDGNAVIAAHGARRLVLRTRPLQRYWVSRADPQNLAITGAAQASGCPALPRRTAGE